ncbi:MAG: hypothetical protein ACREOE_10785 [Gemmatimonadales bacterium]
MTPGPAQRAPMVRQVGVRAVDGRHPAARTADQAPVLGVQRVQVSLARHAGRAAVLAVLEGDPISPTAG